MPPGRRRRSLTNSTALLITSLLKVNQFLLGLLNNFQSHFLTWKIKIAILGVVEQRSEIKFG